jgi:transposase
VIPYGWQPAGEYVKIVSETSPRLNVFGILSRDNKMHAYSVTGSVDTDMIIACLDDFAKNIVTKTVLVLDNASIHSSKKFKAKMGEWMEKGLQIFHLPPYSPHLNAIETLWRKVKYEWLKPADYKSWDSLQNAVETILKSIGERHRIKFSEPEFFKKYKASII